MEMQMCPFLFFLSKALRAYCQGIQLVCHRYSARGGEAATRHSLRWLRDWLYRRAGHCQHGWPGLTTSTPVTQWLGSKERTFYYFMGCVTSKYLQNPPLSCLFTKRESITQPEQSATSDSLASKLMKQTNFRLRVSFKDSLSCDIKLQHDNNFSGDLPN